MDLRVTTQRVEVSHYGGTRVEVELINVDKDDVLNHFKIEDVLDHFSQDDILEYIGKQSCKEHFDLTESK